MTNGNSLLILLYSTARNLKHSWFVYHEIVCWIKIILLGYLKLKVSGKHFFGVFYFDGDVGESMAMEKKLLLHEIIKTSHQCYSCQNSWCKSCKFMLTFTAVLLEGSAKLNVT